MAESTVARVKRPIEERIAEVEGRLGALDTKRKAMIKRRDDLKAQKEGRTVMGTKEERQAFVRAFDKNRGFGLTYAQALAVLDQFYRKEIEGREEILAIFPSELSDLQVRGQEFLAPFLPHAKEADDEGCPLDGSGTPLPSGGNEPPLFPDDEVPPFPTDPEFTEIPEDGF
ncbi:hypothetical protein RU820_05945 [Acidithiobacillus ferrooxidans]|uniref:Uncharacterized protein n=1 Tax=Acidithiobacillus ferrooxidans (strain ATCC 23270 / DSM 14882 / CIP 104768 / NCIMB 8455) TaxID=243159 RepID=B7J8S7_ACIF2|nr:MULTISPECIES: hypothetical protein [Acidithiobacillus]ACK78994.1 hypothetical protein AFE_1245 [Acidithiobacillus ferrooxidans ATCC 23270]MBN6745544.1 hypothetical protein [Acidithiobacillus sp. MC2.2]MBN6748429.1 hypothetical protein [Acidithiobacillus sp. PG05]